MSDFPYTVNLGGVLRPLERPWVMGIVNATPDSFFVHDGDVEAIGRRVRQMVEEGADILDVGACSTRPGAVPVDEAEEMRRLRAALAVVRREAPDMPVSVDTYRAPVAKMCVEEAGVVMVNDVSGGRQDASMFRTVASLRVPYVLTHNTQVETEDTDAFVAEVLRDLGQRLEALHELGVADVIVDPGFGFSKTRRQDYALMRRLQVLHELDAPLLVGVSRKRLVYEPLGTTPEEALGGTTVLHTICLERGANILRVHDVKQAKACIALQALCHDDDTDYIATICQS